MDLFACSWKILSIRVHSFSKTVCTLPQTGGVPVREGGATLGTFG